jgi:hypothetical protein
MGYLLPFPRLKMYLIQLLRPPSTFDSIQHLSSSCSVNNVLLSHTAPYPSTLFERLLFIEHAAGRYLCPTLSLRILWA